MDKIAFLTVAVDDKRYIEQQDRLLKSIYKNHPDSTVFVWTNEYPYDSKSMRDSMYGFKVHAVNHARAQGYWKVIWVDTACILTGRMDPYFELCKRYGVVAVRDDNKLISHCHPKAWDWFGVEPNTDYHLVGGSVFVFDFHNPLCERIFYKWEKAEWNGIFGNSELQGHRHDESCMSLALYACGSEPVPYGDAYYNNVPQPLIIKDHFK